jgi:uncharacterized protein (DUF362 family)
LDGLQCFVKGSPAYGKKVDSGVIVAGSDRVAVDAVGVAILKFHNAEGIVGTKVKNQEQLKRAAEIQVGNLDANSIALRQTNLTSDEKFDDLVAFIKHNL